MDNWEMEMLPYTLNAQQAAEILNVSKNTVYTLMHSEGFPTIHVGKRLLVQKNKLLQWMDEQSGIIG